MLMGQQLCLRYMRLSCYECVVLIKCCAKSHTVAHTIASASLLLLLLFPTPKTGQDLHSQHVIRPPAISFVEPEATYVAVPI